MAIEILPTVRFKKIPLELITVFEALLHVSILYGETPVITGAAYEGYPVGNVHDRGYAVDVRTRNLSDPQRFAEAVERYLWAVSPHYVVLYGDPAHRDHIHIGYAWYFSYDSRKERQHGKC